MSLRIEHVAGGLNIAAHAGFAGPGLAGGINRYDAVSGYDFVVMKGGHHLRRMSVKQYLKGWYVLIGRNGRSSAKKFDQHGYPSLVYTILWFLEAERASPPGVIEDC